MWWFGKNKTKNNTDRYFTNKTISSKMISKKYPWLPSDILYRLDRTYAIADRKWYTKIVADKYWEISTSHDLLRWEPSHDCDNKSILFKVIADGLYKNEKSKKKAQAPAIGVISFRQDNNVYHMINFAIVSCDNDHEIIFIEPQTQKPIILSDTEIMTIRWGFI
jgi:hypothetical protein